MSAHRKRILFVDDDLALLAGLSNVLHRERQRWDMTFVASGDAALVEIGATTFDVVVTDMRMPGIDGAAVVEVLRRVSPATRRVVLSGSDCDAIAEDVDVLLVKPCNARILRQTLERLLAEPAAVATPLACGA